MEVLINAPHAHLSSANVELFRQRVLDGLDVFESKITRVEVYLKDTNAGKGGIDKHCTMEARPKGLKPVAVTHDGASVSDAVDGALEKLHRALDNRFGRLGSRKHEEE